MLSFSSPIGKASRIIAKPHAIQRHVAMLARTPSKILPRLWLSGLYTAVDEEQLMAIGVTHIVSVLEQRPKYPRALKRLKTLHIPVQDVESADLLQHLDVTTAFIKAALEDERNTVLVHCAMGISRSATVVSAYLIATTGMQPHQAIEFLQYKRDIVCPNLAFRRQLEVYAARLRGRRKLRKLVPPPLRAAVTYNALVPERFRWLRAPESTKGRRFPSSPPPLPLPPPSSRQAPPMARTRRSSMG